MGDAWQSIIQAGPDTKPGQRQRNRQGTISSVLKHEAGIFIVEIFSKIERYL